MGIVLRQSFKNVVATYLGFAIGALNTLFLFTYFLSKAQYWLGKLCYFHCYDSLSTDSLWGIQHLGALLLRLHR